MQIEDLGLDRDVERGRRLVGDQQFRLARQGHRDQHALAHAARHLVRVLLDALARVGDADQVEQLDGARPGRRGSSREVTAQHLGDLACRR